LAPETKTADASMDVLRPDRKSVLYPVAVAAAIWILGLIGLAAFSANPVTLNEMQIRRSKFIVTGQRSGNDSLKVSREWRQGGELGEITVVNLDETEMPEGGDFLVPHEAPLVYPATEDAILQLESILKQHDE